MSDSVSNEVRDYLLGRGPGDAAESFEERIFASDELLRAVEEEQSELIDDYLAGTLSEEDENSFRAQMERSTILKEKVEVHRTLLRALERQAVDAHAMRRAERRRWVWSGVVSMAVAVAGGGVLLLHSRRTKIQTPIQVATVSEPVPAPRQSGANAAPDAVFFLSSSVTRGANSSPLLKIPADAKLVELQVELPLSAATVSEWQLAEVDGRVPVPVAAVGETQHVGGEAYVAVKLPTETLPNGVHTIQLVGISATGAGKGVVIVREFRVGRVHGAPGSKVRPLR